MCNKILILLLLFLNSANAFAELSGSERGELNAAFDLYQNGNYVEALAKLDAIQSSNPEVQGAAAFAKARTHNKLQEFSEAITEFRKAISYNFQAPSLDFEFGQALYSSELFTEAQSEFKRSLDKGFRPNASAYYIAYMAQVSKEYATAREYYEKIRQFAGDTDNVKQSALYQLGEMEYLLSNDIQNEEERVNEYKKLVLPIYRHARDFNHSTNTSKEAAARVIEIETKIAAFIPKMINGVPLPRQPYTFRLSFDTEWNSNVITQADDTLVQVSDQDSFLGRLSVLGKYQWNIDRTISIIPEVSSSLTYHERRTAPLVYENDNSNTTLALRTKYEHMIWEKAATANFDTEFNYMLRDWPMQHRLLYYSRYWNMSIGEKGYFLSNTNPSIIKIGIRFFEHYSFERNAIIPSISFTHIFKMCDTCEWSHTLSFDWSSAQNKINDEKNYQYKTNISFIDFIKTWDFSPSLLFGIKDTEEQRPARGYEWLINPSLVFTKNFSRKINGELAYSFTKNYSQEKSVYQYTQHDVRLGANFNF